MVKGFGMDFKGEDISTVVKKYIQKESYAREVIHNLTTGSYVREAPTNLEDITRIVYKKIWENKPVELRVLWGGSRGPRKRVTGKADEITIQFLKNIEKKIGSAIEFEIFLCDTHHYLCNGISDKNIFDYYWSMRKYKKDTESIYKKSKYTLTVEKLSDFIEKRYLTPGIVEKEDNEARTKARMLLQNEAYAQQVIQGTLKHSRWYKQFKALKKFPKNFETYLAQLYVETEIEFLSELGVERFNQSGEYQIKKSDNIIVSLSNPLIQKPIAEVANVPMLFFWSREGRHGEVPWYC